MTEQIPYDELILQLVHYVYHVHIDEGLALHRARHALIDALGCAVETLQTSKECRAFIGPVVAGSTSPNGFRLPGTNYQLDPIKGAFDLSSLIRFLDHNDAYPGAEWGHPSDNLGAILAVTDWLSRTHESAGAGSTTAAPTVRDVIVALTKAYEIEGIYQKLNAFNKVGLDHTLLVKIASTAVTAHLLGLSEAQAASAISHAWADGHPLRIFRQSPNTGPRKGWAAGDATMRAVHLCLLAKADQPGIPTALTEPNWGFLKTSFANQELRLSRPFGTFVMEGVFFKLITAEGHGISAVQAATELAATLHAKGLDPAKDIKHIHVRTHEAAMRIIDKREALTNAADRDHCMRYMIAVVLLKNKLIEAGDYDNDSPWVTDARVETLRQKIDMVEDKQFTEDYHGKRKSASSGLTITLADGTVLDEVVVEFPIGHPMHRDTLPKVQAKFRENMAGMYTEEEIEKILEAVKEDSMPVHHFVDLFVRE